MARGLRLPQVRHAGAAHDLAGRDLGRSVVFALWVRDVLARLTGWAG